MSAEARRGIGWSLLRALIGASGFRLGGMAFSFIVGVLLARVLGPSGYGHYGVAMAVTSLLSIASEVGLPQLVLREVASADARGNRDAAQVVFRWARRAIFAISLALASIVLLWLWVSSQLNSELGVTVAAGLISVIALGQANLAISTLRGFRLPVRAEVPDTFFRPLAFAVVLVSAHALSVQLTPALAMVHSGCAAVATYLVASGLLPRDFCRNPMPEPEKGMKRIWLRSAIPMAVTQWLHVLQGNAILLFVGGMTTSDVAGHFRVASSMVLLLGLPISILNIVSASYIAQLFTHKRMAALQYLMACIAATMFAGTALIVAPVALFGERIILLLFGTNYVEAVPVLRILCIGLLINASLGSNVALMNMTGRHVDVTKAFTASVVVMFISAPVLVHWLGASGAAVCNGLCMFVWNYFLWRRAKSVLNIDTSIAIVLRTPRVLLQRHEL